ncbi:MAG: 1-acyl-sn-glycerol-3-phosphate acyltransferase [Bacteroidales bacterium]
MLSRVILWLMGWKIASRFRSDMRRCVVVMAPHTSNWDFIIGRLVFNVMEVDVHFLIKKEAFRFPLGYFLRRWGGIPVDRGKSGNMVEQVAKYFENRDEMVLVITPEGTRSAVKSLKKGFYYIASKAEVPIVLGFLDYKKKEAGLGPVISPGTEYSGVSRLMENFYRDKTAKHPRNFNLSAIRR